MHDSIYKLTETVRVFCEERDWNQFHNPKDLAIGISTEANELLDIFRFKNEEDMKMLFATQKSREHIEEEVGDIFFFLIRFAQMNQIDLEQALLDKIEKNSKKYSIEKAKGSNKKYNE